MEPAIIRTPTIIALLFYTALNMLNIIIAPSANRIAKTTLYYNYYMNIIKIFFLYYFLLHNLYTKYNSALNIHHNYKNYKPHTKDLNHPLIRTIIPHGTTRIVNSSYIHHMKNTNRMCYSAKESRTLILLFFPLNFKVLPICPQSNFHTSWQSVH